MIELLSDEERDAISRIGVYGDFLVHHISVLCHSKDELDFNYWKNRVLSDFMVISESVKVFQKGASND